MAIAVTDLIQDATREGVLDVFYKLGNLVGLTTTAYQPGEPVPAVLDLLAQWIADKWNNPIAPALRSQFFDFASGDWLTLRAWTQYNRKRRLQTFATGPITVENRAGGFYTLSPGDIRVKNGAGKTFTNTTGGNLAAWTGSGAYPKLTMTFQADEAGSGSNTAIGNILAALVLGPANVYAQPNTVALQGIDKESDQSLTRRCKVAPATMAPAAPRNKYEAFALDATLPDGLPSWLNEGGVAVSVTRVKIIEPGGSVVNIHLADPSGPASGDAVTYGTDVYACNAAIQLFCASAGVTVNVYPAAAKAVDLGTITLRIDRKSNLTTTEAIAAATKALTAYFQELPIGGHKLSAGGTGYLLMDEVRAVARDSAPGIYLASCPSVDVALAANEVVVPTFAITAVIVDQK